MFFQVDDQFQVNPKAVGLARAALKGDVTGLAALGVWTIMGSHCQAALTDGVVAFVEIVAATLNPVVSQQLADRLVDAGLWHVSGHSCERCPSVEAETFLFHDWFGLGYDRGDDVKVKRDKSKELKSRSLVNSVWARDCIDPADPNVGACRYCSKRLHKKDTRGVDGPEMDHVDPTKAAGVRNVVLACGSCNRKKAGKTPEAAGMVLQPAPVHHVSVEPVVADSPGSAVAESAPGATMADAVSAAWKPFFGTQGEPVQAPTSAKTSTGTSARPAPEPVQKSMLACAGDRAGAGRAGQGRVEEGLRKGSGEVTSPAPNRTRRRRGKGRPNPAPSNLSSSTAPKPVSPRNPHDAGDAPIVPSPAQFGSPWHGWSGRPSDVTETTCSIHGLEQPCRKCEDCNV